MFARFHRALRIAAVLPLLIVAVGIGAPYLGADYFQGRIERALESALGRKVNIGKTHYNLFTGPGFTIDEVTIEEDPRIGIEPFAFAQQVDARVGLLSLLTGKMEFSSLRLIEPNINFARAADGTWNVQLFLDRAPAKTLPPISIRSGRLHVKFEDRKEVIYLGDTDADINHSSDGRVRLAFTGEAFRGDRPSQGLCRLALRGSYLPAASGPGRVDLDFELERDQVQDLVKLFDGRDLGLKGLVESQAHLSGPLDQVAVRGQLKTSELAARLFLPSGGSGALPYEGTVNFIHAEASLSSSGTTVLPISLRFGATNFMRHPDWNAEMNFQELAVPAALDIARQFGLTLPAGMDVKGKLQGAMRFNKNDGVTGDFELAEPVIQLPAGGVLGDGALRFEVHGAGVDLRLHTAEEPGQKIEVDGRYELETKTMALAITSRGSRIAETRKLFGSLPLLEHFVDGAWRGTLRYVSPEDAEPAWHGQIDITQAQVEIPGIADKVTISFPALIEGARAVVRNFRGTVGTVTFSGDYKYEPAAPRPHRMNLVVASATLAEVERIFRPTLVRSGGLLARTLRLGRAPVPDWLQDRRLEGSIRFGSLQTGDWTWKSAQARMTWNGTNVRLTNLEGSLEDATLNGEATIDLSGSVPVYSAKGTLAEMTFHGGQLDLKGKVSSQGAGEQVVANAKIDGTFEGSEIRFSPETLFDRATGAFELLFPGGTAKAKLTNLEVSQGADTYQGQGATQADGRLALDLTSGLKQLKAIGSLLAAQPSTQ